MSNFYITREVAPHDIRVYWQGTAFSFKKDNAASYDTYNMAFEECVRISKLFYAADKLYIAIDSVETEIKLYKYHSCASCMFWSEQFKCHITNTDYAEAPYKYMADILCDDYERSKERIVTGK